MTSNSTITPELLDQLLANYEKPEDLTGENGLFKQLKKALIPTDVPGAEPPATPTKHCRSKICLRQKSLENGNIWEIGRRLLGDSL